MDTQNYYLYHIKIVKPYPPLYDGGFDGTVCTWSPVQKSVEMKAKATAIELTVSVLIWD